MLIAKSILLFITAGRCEIGGGYLIWLWLRDGKGIWFAIAGAIILILYGIVPTFQPAHILGGYMQPMAAFSLFYPFSGAGKSTKSGQTALI